MAERKLKLQFIYTKGDQVKFSPLRIAVAVYAHVLLYVNAVFYFKHLLVLRFVRFNVKNRIEKKRLHIEQNDKSSEKIMCMIVQKTASFKLNNSIGKNGVKSKLVNIGTENKIHW